MGEPPDRPARIEDLVRGYARLVRSVAVRFGGRQVADDVEQIVFLNLWKQLEREQTIDRPASYIYRCAVRETIRLLKSNFHGPAPIDPSAAADDPPDPKGSPEALAAGRETAEVVKAAVEELPQDRRRAVRAHLQGFDVNEIMDMYDWPYQKARNLIARGMAELRTALRARGIDG